MTTRFTFVRHGQIQANLDQRWHGSTDSPLTTVGRTQVDRVASHLATAGRPFQAIYASPLQRTRDTAAAIAAQLGLTLNVDARLREYGVGELEDRSYLELRDQLGFFERITRDRHYAPTGGESLHAVVTRMAEAIEALADRHPGAELLVVGHGAALGILLGHLIDNDAMAWTRYALDNCSITEFVLRPTPALLRVNSTEHLV